MGMGLLEIRDQELRFTFELKKLCSCSVELVNKTDDYVAFKVKTTSPKRYCVRPNTGVIQPRSTYDFTVTMQALRVAPPDMQLKDKFLVQSTIVPFGTQDEDILPSFFSKESGRHIEEHKLRVLLVSPPNSPVLQPINGALKQEPAYEAATVKEAPILKEAPIVKVAPTLNDAPIVNDAPVVKELPIQKEAFIYEETPTFEGSITSKDQAITEDETPHPSHVDKDVEDLKLKLIDLEIKLNEADKTTRMLTEEKSITIQHRDKLQQEIAAFKRIGDARIQVGFPLFFVLFIALVSMALGYLIHP